MPGCCDLTASFFLAEGGCVRSFLKSVKKEEKFLMEENTTELEARFSFPLGLSVRLPSGVGLAALGSILQSTWFGDGAVG